MDVLNEKNIRKLLPCLLILFVLTNLMVQAFVTVSPVLAEEFHVSASKVSMIVTLSTVALGVCSVVYGTLSDYIPVKKLLLFGTAVFVSGSAFGLLFQNYFYMVVAARVLQTVGQAAISSLYLVITSRYTKGKEKLKYFAWFTACFQIAQACGVLAGGIFAAYVNWKALFVISLAAAAFIPVIWKYAPVENEGKIKHVDVVGIGLFSICIVAIMLMLSDFRPVYAGIEILMLAVFFIYISKREDAFVTPGFFRENRNYTKAVILVFALYLSQFVFAFICTFVVSTLYPRSLDLVSYILLPGYIAAAVVGMNGDKITARLGRYQTISLGAFLIFLGLLSAAFFMDKGKIVLSISGIIFFAGYNTIYSPLLDTVTGALPSAEVGRGIGINDLTINISSSIGVAICSRFMMVNYLKQHVIAPVSESVYVYSNIFIILSLAAIISLISFRKSMKVFY
ncbi:MFS transporter [uncultured Robinsoniella sp.]|uniref:MFS transporter n=1 Tax=uncultured Robinsoniella sp. TaxID=904190 RepID=UPI00374E4759